MASTGGAGGVAILGGGNLGQALARGWVENGGLPKADLVVTRRRLDKLEAIRAMGVEVTSDNAAAVGRSRTIVICVQPQQVEELLGQIRTAIDGDVHRVISVATGVSIDSLRRRLAVDNVSMARAMPNMAVSIREAMTCLASDQTGSPALEEAQRLFELVGLTLQIPEEMMTPATALCACGVAFFLRSVRAASQGGIEIGFHPDEALQLAAQTARGAASLLLQAGSHPEQEIDRVTTPRGCTIAGLNEMEHQGFSSAMIRGIILSARQAAGLAD